MSDTPTQPLTRHQRRELQRQQRRQQQSSGQRNRSTKKIGVWVAIIIGVGLAIWGIGTAMQNPDLVKPPLAQAVEGDWSKGPADAKTVLIEYSDLQCPACAAYKSTLSTFLEKNDGKIRFIYRHFPLKQIHQHAVLAGRWAEAAGMQGKFWEFHDILFDKQPDWRDLPNPISKFEEYAGTLELNLDQLRTDANSQAAKDAVEAEYQTGVAGKVDSTPTFFLNGELMAAPKNFTDFTTTLQAAVDSAG